MCLSAQPETFISPVKPFSDTHDSSTAIFAVSDFI